MQQEITKNQTIEKYLNKTEFNGIKIGSLIAQSFALNFINKGLHQNLIVNLLVLLKYIITLWNNKKTEQYHADFLFTKLDNRFHFNELMDPLISHYRNNSIVLYDNNSFDHNKFNIHDINDKTILFTQTISNTKKDSLKILRVIFSVSYLLLRNKKKLKLTYHEVLYYINNLLIQLRRTSFWNHYFTIAEYKPLCVVTEFDRFLTATPLILAARKHNIQTITLIHGVLEDYSFTPFLADYIFCWGEGQKSQLISKGVDPKRIFITGNPMFKDHRSNKYSEESTKNLCLCLAISPGFDNSSLIEPFASALNSVENVHGILKLHPSLKKEDFKWIEALSSKIEILTSKDILNSDMFQKIDLLIIHDSGIANEALDAGVPVTVLMSNSSQQLNNFQIELIKLAGCRLVTNEQDLANNFIELASNPIQFRLNAEKMGEKYLKMLYDTAGKDSVKAMISQIDKISEQRY